MNFCGCHCRQNIGANCCIQRSPECRTNPRKNTYVRQRTPSPTIGWCNRYVHPDFLAFKTHGSYAGRHRAI